MLFDHVSLSVVRGKNSTDSYKSANRDVGEIIIGFAFFSPPRFFSQG